MRSRLPWIVWTVTVLGLVASPVIVLSGDGVGGGSVEPLILVAFTLFVLGFATVGALIVSRHPSNPVGWLCVAAALAYVCGGLADTLVNSYSDEVRGAGAVARTFVAVGESLWAVGLGLGATLLLLLFPDGRLPSSRWRPAAWAASTCLTVLPLSLILTPGRIQDYPVQNPVGIPGAGPALEAVAGIAFLGFLGLVPVSIASLFFRYRNAPPRQRQQLKWLLFAAALVVVLFSAATVVDIVGKQSETAGEVSNFLLTAALSFIPMGIGVAVLRHRLYDIDVIINRALVYTGLTAVLALTYIAIVFALQQVLSPVTQESDLAIAASTLAVAALFRPARSGLQDFIDRRFYRRKFDAQRTLDDFTSSLRDEVDLAALSNRLTDVVATAMQPRHISLWVKGPGG
jgi:hypothetical protein